MAEIEGGRKKREEPKPSLSGLRLENYELPLIDLLDPLDEAGRRPADHDELRAVQAIIIETLAHFGIGAKAGDITRGPTITRFEVYPDSGVRVDRITSLERDIARAIARNGSTSSHRFLARTRWESRLPTLPR